MAVLGLTTGCPAGVGPEITVQAIADADIDAGCELRYFGPASLLLRGAQYTISTARLVDDDLIVIRPSLKAVGAREDRRVRCSPSTSPEGREWSGVEGRPDDEGRALSAASILAAVEAAKAGEIDGLCTAPIQKAALDAAPGAPWPGHTELLAHHLGDGRPPAMVFSGGPFLLGLVTTHLPLREVPDAITKERITWALDRLVEADRMFGSSSGTRPYKITVLGLNPHAGEGGRLGLEEREVIAPAVAAYERPGVEVVGPVPADGFFGEVGRRQASEDPAFAHPRTDAALAMAHDVGLAAYKALAQGHGVNITIGLKVPRTSPDHGTAYAVAGGPGADASSMAEALSDAAFLARVSVERRPT